MSIAFGSQGPAIPHLARGNEVADLRSDIEEAFGKLEGHTDYPKLFRANCSALFANGLPYNMAVVGENITQDQVKASRVFGTGNSEITFEANRPGTPGNSIKVELKTGGAESVSVVGDVITVTLDTGTSTPNSVKATVDADTNAARLAQVAVGGTGAGILGVAAAVFLAGGVGEGIVVKINDVAQEVNGPVTNVSLPVEVTTLPSLTRDDAALLEVTTNGKVATPLVLTAAALKDLGYVACAELIMSAQPTATNTIGIGADTYEFDGVGANINVVIGGDAAATQANLINAINGVLPIGGSTENVVADANGTSVRVKHADAPGGNPVVGLPASMVLAEAIAAAADVWNQDNLFNTGSAGLNKTASGVVVATARNIATLFSVNLEFTPVRLVWKAYTTASVPEPTSATVVINGDALDFDLDAGGDPLVATDYVEWHCFGN